MQSPNYERNLNQAEIDEYQFKHQDRTGEDPFHMRTNVEGRITYEFDSIVSKMRENIRNIEIHPEEITLYNIFFTGLEIIESHSKKINLNTKILLDNFRWYELRFFFYWSYINPDNKKHLDTIKRLRIKIPDDYYYNWETHPPLFK